MPFLIAETGGIHGCLIKNVWGGAKLSKTSSHTEKTLPLIYILRLRDTVFLWIQLLRKVTVLKN